MGITIKDIANSACAPLNQHLFQKKEKKVKGESKIGGRLVVKHFPKKSEEKNWIEIILIEWSQKRCIQLYEEYRFTEDRMWRFDWCIPALKLAIEYEGLMSEKSRHTTRKGFTGDADKYNRAASDGWRVLRFTAMNYKTLIETLKELK
jgi:hypothetical protein